MFLALWALIGCGGGTSSTNSGPAPTQTASYLGTAAQQGQWYTLPYTMPTNPVHAALLHTGKALIVSGSGNDPNDASPIDTITDDAPYAWHPQIGQITAQPIGWDSFCNRMS